MAFSDRFGHFPFADCRGIFALWLSHSAFDGHLLPGLRDEPGGVGALSPRCRGGPSLSSACFSAAGGFDCLDFSKENPKARFLYPLRSGGRRVFGGVCLAAAVGQRSGLRASGARTHRQAVRMVGSVEPPLGKSKDGATSENEKNKPLREKAFAFVGAAFCVWKKRRSGENGQGIGDGLFHCFSAVFVHIRFVFIAVGQAAGAVDTAADASHSLDKIAV